MNKEVQKDARHIWGKVNDVKFIVYVVKVKWNGRQWIILLKNKFGLYFKGSWVLGCRTEHYFARHRERESLFFLAGEQAN